MGGPSSCDMVIIFGCFSYWKRFYSRKQDEFISDPSAWAKSSPSSHHKETMEVRWGKFVACLILSFIIFSFFELEPLAHPFFFTVATKGRFFKLSLLVWIVLRCSWNWFICPPHSLHQTQEGCKGYVFGCTWYSSIIMYKQTSSSTSTAIRSQQSKTLSWIRLT